MKFMKMLSPFFMNMSICKLQTVAVTIRNREIGSVFVK